MLAMTDRPTLPESYSAAVHATNLAVEVRTRRSPSDVLGAYGFADRALTTGRRRTGKREEDVEHLAPCPLAVPLARLFAGDNRASREIVSILAGMAFDQSWRIKVKITRPDCHDMACATLAWHRNGRCDPCNGSGYALVPGTGRDGIGGVLSERECECCKGGGRRELEREFRPEHRELARWLVSEMERAMGQAGPAAMRSLCERMEL